MTTAAAVGGESQPEDSAAGSTVACTEVLSDALAIRPTAGVQIADPRSDRRSSTVSGGALRGEPASMIGCGSYSIAS